MCKYNDFKHGSFTSINLTYAQRLEGSKVGKRTKFAEVLKALNPELHALLLYVVSGRESIGRIRISHLK